MQHTINNFITHPLFIGSYPATKLVTHLDPSTDPYCNALLAQSISSCAYVTDLAPGPGL